MTRRSNRTRGTRSYSQGLDLKARRIKPMARAVRGSLGLEAAEKYAFNGTDMYATMSDWTPLGLPFSVEVEAVPLTSTNNAIYDSASNTLKSRLNNGILQQRFSDGTIVQTFGTVAYPANTQLDISADFVFGNSTLNANGNTEQLAVGAAPLSNDVGVIAAFGPNPAADNFHGPIWNLRLTDNSPIQDTTACFGNANRYVPLENPIALAGAWEIEFDLIREPTSISSWLVPIGNANTADQWGILYFGAGAAGNENTLRIYFDDNSQAVFAGALGDVALGQHFRLKLTYDGSTAECFVDNVSKGTASAASKTFTISSLAGGAAPDRAINPEQALQNIRIKDITNDREWLYKLDEGSGTAALNTGKTQGNYLDQPMWDTTVLEGNGTRYIEIPELSSQGGDFLAEFDWIRADATGGDNTQAFMGKDGSLAYFIAARNTDHPTLANSIGVRTSTNTAREFLGALDDIAIGQHCTIKVTKVGNDIEVFVDGVSKGVDTDSGYMRVDLIGKYSGGLPLPVGASMQNVVIEAAGEYVQYKIDEGSGTVIKAYDSSGDEIPIGPELWVEPFDTFDSNWTDNGDGSYTSDGGSGSIQKNGTLTANKRYQYSLTLTGRTAGNINVSFGGNTIGGKNADGTYEGVISATSPFLSVISTSCDATITLTVKEYPNGTVTPDASWAVIPEYSNNGDWTPDVDWQEIPDNSRRYPMDLSVDSRDEAKFKCFDGNNERVPAADATIVNYDENAWGTV